MISLKKSFVIALAAALLTAALPGGASAAEGSWEYTLVPYLWLAGIDGDVRVGNRTFEPSADFGDILESLDFGLMGHFEARKGKLGLFLQPTYLKLSTGRTVGPVKTELETTTWLIEFGALYEIWASETGGGTGAALNLLGGGRYISLDNEIKVPGAFSARDSNSGVDPIIGARLNVDLHEKVPFLLRGDVGGFGVNSEGAWQVLALLGYRFTPSMTLWGGYRALDVDVEEGERDERFEANVTMSGPIVGFAFGF